VEHPWFRAVNIQEFDHQNTEEEGETDVARNEGSAVESQLNQGQQVPDEGQENSINPSRYVRYQIVPFWEILRSESGREFERQNAEVEKEEETHAARNKGSAVESQLNQEQGAPNKGQ
jgi:hypothetical protein